MSAPDDVLSLLDEILAVRQPCAEGAPAAAPPRVLVADDSEDYRAIVVYLLRKAGCVVTEAVTGKQALAAARRELPDLLIIDLAMPELNGYEVIGELRSQTDTMQLPVIVLTGAENCDRLREIIDGFGVQAFLS